MIQKRLNEIKIQIFMNKWSSENIQLNKGSSLKLITELEEDIGFEFPEDFKQLYLSDEK